MSLSTLACFNWSAVSAIDFATLTYTTAITKQNKHSNSTSIQIAQAFKQHRGLTYNPTRGLQTHSAATHIMYRQDNSSHSLATRASLSARPPDKSAVTYMSTNHHNTIILSPYPPPSLSLKQTRTDTHAHLSLVDRDPRLGVEELGLQGTVDALVVLALGGHGQPVRGGVLHLQGPLQAVVIAQDICRGRRWEVGAKQHTIRRVLKYVVHT